MSFWKCFSCLRFPSDENITKLDYTNGTLTDVPPDVSQFERTLEELFLSSNRISDLPPELFYCQGIRVLKLNDNELETIPNAIGSLRQLQVLDLSRNALTNIPENIKSCKYLTHLDLSLNNLQRLPDAITNLISLQELLLNETYLEFLPANFGRLVNLKILELRSNNLITLPKSMSRLIELIRIDIGANEFTELPEVIGQLTQLRELWIDYNRIRRISSNISNLRDLIHFEANSNQLTGLPNEISYWRNLEVLSLSANDLETLPFSVGMLKRLVTLKADSNQLKELPDSICHLEQLEELIINHNYMMRLPNTIGLLRKMKFLIADENLLRRIPNELSSCSALAVLSLRGNKLAELPHDIGHLSNLRVLNIVDNSITNLPVSVLNLSNLTALWISDNQSQPLVPLQYSDSARKSLLTCFMLPQPMGGGGGSSATLIGGGNDDGSAWFEQQQRQLHQQHGSPSRRICFADEANPKTNDAITTRLMRSPTPYPKELRLMAKFATRNMMNCNSFQQPRDGNHLEIIDETHQPPHNTSSSAASQPVHRIKEAKVLQTINGQPPDHHHNSPTPLSVTPMLPNCDITDAQINLIDSTTTNGHHHHHHHHPQLHEPSSPKYNNYYNSLKLMNDTKSGSDYSDSNLYNSSTKTNSINNSYTTWNQTPSSEQQYNNYQQQQPRQPPPYHIAKAFTKKSREDLLTYDSIRKRTTSTELLNIMNSRRDSQISLSIDDNYNNTDDYLDLNNSRSSNNNNNIDDDGLNDANSDDGPQFRPDYHYEHYNNHQHHHQPIESENSMKQSAKFSTTSSQWLFGLHRNPTVKQVIVKKDPILGFEIKEIPNQGIFVSITMPNTTAAQLLRIDDKILDVDGIDFSKIPYHDAQQILDESGPVINIMISRT